MEEIYALAGKRVWVAGHRGMVGGALVRRLKRENCASVLTAGRSEVDLTDQASTRAWMEDRKPDAIFLAAAKVGGIQANDAYPADFLYDNMMIAANVIHAAHDLGVEKLVYLGSSCVYPRSAAQPMTEDQLLTGPLEPTNEWYAVAKIAGVKLCQAYRKQHGADFISAMPTNLYGPGDNFHPQDSHVVPALLRKARAAKAAGRRDLEIWGTGAPRREFMHVDDCADALVFLAKRYSGHDLVNVGVGRDVTIEELARKIMAVAGLEGELLRDASKPDGTPRKLMSCEKLRGMGWTPRIPLDDGLRRTYDWYVEHVPLGASRA